MTARTATKVEEQPVIDFTYDQDAKKPAKGATMTATASNVKDKPAIGFYTEGDEDFGFFY